MVVRTKLHNEKISRGMILYHKKARRAMGGEYMGLLGQAARYRLLKKSGQKTKKQQEMATKRSKPKPVKKPKSKTTKTKKKAVVDEAFQRAQTSGAQPKKSNVLIKRKDPKTGKIKYYRPK